MSTEIPDIYRGDTPRLKLTFKDAAGAAIPIAGWVIWSTLKVSDSDADTDAKFDRQDTVPAGADATAGIYYLQLTEANTNQTPGQYRFSLGRVIPGSPRDVRTLKVQSIKILARGNDTIT